MYRRIVRAVPSRPSTVKADRSGRSSTAMRGGHHGGGEGFVQDSREGRREWRPTPEGKGQTTKDAVQLGDPGRQSESPAEPLRPVQNGQEATDFRATP